MVKKICVFCASSNKIPAVYFNAAKELANEFLKNKITLVYGGGSIGLMGELSNYMIRGNGKVIGIIPRFMMEREWGNKAATEMIVVDTMHERKQKLIEEAEAIVALPGGCGTMDELMETITLKQLGQHTKPIIIVNTNGFYNSLIEFLDRMVEENFMREMHKKIWTVVGSPAEVIPAIDKSPGWNKDYIQFAEI